VVSEDQFENITNQRIERAGEINHLALFLFALFISNSRVTRKYPGVVLRSGFLHRHDGQSRIADATSLLSRIAGMGKMELSTGPATPVAVA